MPEEKEPEKLEIDPKLGGILDMFVVESRELVDAVGDDLLVLEKDNQNTEVVNSIFRNLHTVKGNSKGFELPVLTNLVHRTEEVVRALKDHSMPAGSGCIDILLRASDTIKEFLDDLHNRLISGQNISPLLAELETEVGRIGSPTPESAGPGHASLIEPAGSQKLGIDPKLEQLLDLFVLESLELVDAVADDLLVLEKDNQNTEVVNSIFRNLHTVKGNSKGFDLPRLTDLMHRTEDVIKALKDHSIPAEPSCIDLMLRASDTIRELLGDLQNRIVSSQNITSLLAELETTAVHMMSPTGEGAEPGQAPPTQPDKPQKLDIDPKLGKILDMFVVESRELIEGIIENLVVLEKDNKNHDLINSIFRDLHTIKGNSKGFDLPKLTDLVHRTEDVIRTLKEKPIPAETSYIDALLRASDTIKQLLQDIENRIISAGDTSSLLAELETAVKQISPPSPETVKPALPPGLAKLELEPELEVIIPEFLDESRELIENLDKNIALLKNKGPEEEIIKALFRSFHTFKGLASALGFKEMQTVVQKSEVIIRKIRDRTMVIVPDVTSVLVKSIDTVRILVVDIANRAVSRVNMAPLLEELTLVSQEKYKELHQFRNKLKKAVSSVTKVPRSAMVPSTIRVDLSKLDQLINSAGELILAKNKLLDFSRRLESDTLDQKPHEFLDSYNAELGLLTSDMQTMIMRSRMQPINRVFSKYPRIVRDLSRELSKVIELVVQGEDTELDNSIVEEIGDPLIHLVRNSCDHGIETPDEREKQGKPPHGTITLSAIYEGNYAVIRIDDDGKGIDENGIREKGIELGLINEGQAAFMTKSEVLGLIFEPGFSTASQVTSVSGRGVGMDVVKSKITSLKGSVELDSTKGSGTCTTIRLPLTLAVMKVLEIQSGREKYLIPLEHIRETVLVPARDVEPMMARETYVSRNEELPIVPLGTFLAIPGNAEKALQAQYLVIVNDGNHTVALMVDNIIQQHEVLIKPLGSFLGHFSVRGVSGATIMGDGSVALILDCKRIVKESAAMAVRG